MLINYIWIPNLSQIFFLYQKYLNEYYKRFILKLSGINVYFSMWFFHTYLELEISVVCREFFCFWISIYCFLQTIRWLFIFVHQKSWKQMFKTIFLVLNIHLFLCGQKYNTIWILCSRKICVKCLYLRFPMYKTY